MDYFSDRWGLTSLDIYDALGDLAIEIGPSVEPKYITSFNSILNDDAFMSINIGYRLRVLFKRCGINATGPDVIPLLGEWRIVTEYLELLYISITLSSNGIIRIPNSIVDTMHRILTKSLPSKYNVLKDSKMSKYIVNNIIHMNAILGYVDLLHPHGLDGVCLYFIHNGIVKINAFYLYVIAYKVSNGSKHMEPYLINFMHSVGIYDPTNDPSRYILDNLHTYPKSITHALSDNIPALWFEFPLKSIENEQPMTMTDVYFIQRSGVILPYKNYTDHYNMYNSYMDGTDSWFVPTADILRRKQFTETSMSMEDIEDTYIVGYGHRNNEHFYSTYEIRESISIEDNIKWNLPNFTKHPLEKDVRSLLIILSRIGDTRTCNKINEYFSIVNEDEVIDTSKPYKHFLELVVELGLYARRWKGKGNPFPYSKKDSNDLNVNPAIGMTVIISKINAIVKSWDNKPILKTYIKSEIMGNNLIEYIDRVAKGNQCVRIASDLFIHTGQYHLRKLYDASYPDLDMSMIENISYMAPEEQRH